MARQQSYRDLIAWQKAMQLVPAIYRVTAEWPREERLGLTNQIRRAAVAIPANIAEGQGRLGSRELKHHLSIAHGSLCELETHLLIGQDLGFSDEPTLRPLLLQADEVGRVLRGFIRSLD